MRCQKKAIFFAKDKIFEYNENEWKEIEISDINYSFSNFFGIVFSPELNGLVLIAQETDSSQIFLIYKENKLEILNLLSKAPYAKIINSLGYDKNNKLLIYYASQNLDGPDFHTYIIDKQLHCRPF